MKLPTLLAAPALLAALATSAAAENSVQTQAAPESKHSINVSPLGLLVGNLYLTYEHLWSGGHGVIVDAGGGRSQNADGAETHGAIGVGYRWHWRGRQNSGFLGLSLHQQVGEGYVEENGERYDMNVRSTMLTANVGKRWMLNEDWNITLRFGLGLGAHTATAQEDTPEAKMAEERMNALLALIPIGVEGELSIGYNF